MKNLIGLCSLICLLTAATIPAFAGTVPYSNTFTSTSDISDWTTLGTIATSSWSVVSGGFYEGTGVGASSGNFSSIVPLTNYSSSGLSGFTVNTTFAVTDPSSSVNIGLVALSSGDLKNTLLADVTGGGTMRIGYFANGAFTSLSLVNSGDSITALNVNKTWTVTLGGTYETNGSLSLTYILTDGSATAIRTASVGSSIVSNTLVGQYFGLRLNDNTANDTLTVQFDSFSVATTAIPEPSTYALLAGLTMLGLASLRRSGRR